jgi:ribosomal-protein-alanine N-acetyltransferase
MPAVPPRHADSRRTCRPRLRHARPDDLRAIARIDAASFPDPDGWRLSDFRRDFAKASTIYLVAECAGRIVGYANASRDGDAAWLLAVAVTPEHRRLGLAARFMDAYLDWAEAEDVDEALLQVAHTNGAAARLYLDLGFEITGDLRHYYGPGRHATEMRKLLV